MASDSRCFGVARYTALEDLFPERVGTSVGIVLAAADAGQALLPPLAGILAVTVLWQLGFAYTLPLFVVVTVALWRYVPTRTSGSSNRGTVFSLKQLRYVLKNIHQGPVLYSSVMFVVYVTVWITFTGFYPTYLISIKEISPTLAGALFGMFFAVGVAIKPLSGIAYDRVGIRVSLLTITGISAISLVTLPLVENVVTLAIITVFIAPILGSGTITQSHIIESLASDVKGTGLGFIRTGGMMIAAVAPAIFGAIADRGHFDEVFFILAGFACVTILLIIRFPSR